MNILGQKYSERHHAISDDIRKAFHVHLLNLDRNLYYKIYWRVNQVVDRNYILPDIDEAHCHTPADLAPNYNYDYTHCMTMVYISSTMNT